MQNGPNLDELDRMLSESPAAIDDRERNTFWRLADPFGKSFVIFGAGQLGRKVARALRQHGIEPLAFADSNQKIWGTSVDGIPVRSPADAAAEWGQRAAFVISIWPSRASDTYADRERRLQELGCVKVIPYLSLFWTDPAAYLPHFSLDAPRSILAEDSLIRRCAGLWSDPASLHAFVGILRWRLLADFSGIPARSSHEQYFADDLFRVEPSEVFVDCGAYDGDTIRALSQRLDGKLCRIFALEPDEQNFAKLQAYLTALGARAESITAFPYAVGRRRETLRFSATGTDNASVAPEGSVTVEAVPLDELLADESPTFIKMDIEGFELEALAGAAGVIRRCRPIMAITVYHHSDHLWKVPLAIAAAADPEFDTDAPADYSFFLRSYQTEFWETVCYAVPRSRRIQKGRDSGRFQPVSPSA
ncbi:MAG TPA: FkbM family methyltransferase [Planctomycetaceae bacterium]|nr:FkbM family methyltransferase [Planctomycetaceae bacterium]